MDFADIQDSMDRLNARLNSYVNSLTEYQKYAWIGIIAGILLVVLAIILW